MRNDLCCRSYLQTAHISLIPRNLADISHAKKLRSIKKWLIKQEITLLSNVCTNKLTIVSGYTVKINNNNQNTYECFTIFDLLKHTTKIWCKPNNLRIQKPIIQKNNNKTADITYGLLNIATQCKLFLLTGTSFALYVSVSELFILFLWWCPFGIFVKIFF